VARIHLINFDPMPRPLAPRLQAVTDVLKNFDLGRRGLRAPMCGADERHWNWKVRFENSNDGYHANRLHGGPIHDACPSDLASFPELPADTAGYFRYNATIHPELQLQPTLKALLPIFPKLTTEDRSRFPLSLHPPTLTMFARCDMVTFNVFSRRRPEEMSTRAGWLTTTGAMKDPLFAHKRIESQHLRPIFEQDRYVMGCVRSGCARASRSRPLFLAGAIATRVEDHWLVPALLGRMDRSRSPRFALSDARKAAGPRQRLSRFCCEGCSL